MSIVPRGRALGATRQVPLDDHHNYSRRYLFTRLVVLLGGRAAEELCFGETTTGAEDDLRQATMLARQMVAGWGMSRLGPIGFEAHEGFGVWFPPQHDYSEATAAAIDRETERLLADAQADVAKLLGEHRPALERIAEALLQEENLDRTALGGLLRDPDATAAAATIPEKSPRVGVSPAASTPDPGRP